jgi:hypothetical protein
MPRTIQIDNVKILRMTAFQDEGTGEVHVFAEYELRTGRTPIQTVHRDLTKEVGPGRKTALLAILRGLVEDAAGLEQVG